MIWNGNFKIFYFTAFVQDSDQWVVANVSAGTVEHVHIFHIENVGQKHWHRHAETDDVRSDQSAGRSETDQRWRWPVHESGQQHLFAHFRSHQFLAFELVSDGGGVVHNFNPIPSPPRFSALIRLLKESCSSAGLPKFTELLMKCIWRNVKVMPEKADELDYTAMLTEIDAFLAALPSSWWVQRPSDTPLRTIKTILHHMAKLKGNDIMVHLQAIPMQSELYSYMMRVLKVHIDTYVLFTPLIVPTC